MNGLTDARRLVTTLIEPAVHAERLPLTVTARHLPGEPVGPNEAVAGPFAPFAVGDRWGGMWGTTWFRFSGNVPERWHGREVVALLHLGGARTVGFSAEGMVFDMALRPVQGLHHEHRRLPIADCAEAGAAVEFYVEAAANPIPRWHMADWPRLDPDYGGRPLYRLEQADLATRDREVEALWLDARLLLDLAERIPDRCYEILGAVESSLGLFAGGGAEAAVQAGAKLAPLLAEKGPEPAPGAGRHTLVGVGHAHIDTAWLWPLRETRRKCARTFANQLRLLERYPEHHFVCSQAAQYEWIRQDHPELFEAIRAQVAAGRWEPVGGMWVEADSNLPSGPRRRHRIRTGRGSTPTVRRL